ncbi:hypothetical protein [Rhizobium sp. S163]|uniref:hypothetical protein n=1 Tax=Rhizobium sp. S163 TaxID=3055039 RepID=UPI0025A99649|nr:hypothetical protein [Rhizobium sp. S163]MDM9644317.1 hypothetical protein [Rhizobium sp. S163]
MNELARLVAEQSRFDYEDAGVKAPHGDIAYKGVVLSSRYNVASEFARMRKVIDRMPELMARRLESIWCDSKASSVYAVEILPRHYAEELPSWIQAAFIAGGGYNGLSIECGGRDIDCIENYWPEPELEAFLPSDVRDKIQQLSR